MSNKLLRFIGTTIGIAGGTAVGAASGYLYAVDKESKKNQDTITAKDARISKFYSYFQILNKWLEIKNSGRTLDYFFVSNNIRTIAIYGMGELGHRLYEELKDSDVVEIKYAIDRKGTSFDSGIEVIEINCNLPEVDAIIVTPVFDYNNVEAQLADVCEFEVISLEEVVFFGE